MPSYTDLLIRAEINNSEKYERIPTINNTKTFLFISINCMSNFSIFNLHIDNKFMKLINQQYLWWCIRSGDILRSSSLSFY